MRPPRHRGDLTWQEWRDSGAAVAQTAHRERLAVLRQYIEALSVPLDDPRELVQAIVYDLDFVCDVYGGSFNRATGKDDGPDLRVLVSSDTNGTRAIRSPDYDPRRRGQERALLQRRINRRKGGRNGSAT